MCCKIKDILNVLGAKIQRFTFTDGVEDWARPAVFDIEFIGDWVELAYTLRSPVGTPQHPAFRYKREKQTFYNGTGAAQTVTIETKDGLHPININNYRLYIRACNCTYLKIDGHVLIGNE